MRAKNLYAPFTEDGARHRAHARLRAGSSEVAVGMRGGEGALRPHDTRAELLGIASLALSVPGARTRLCLAAGPVAPAERFPAASGGQRRVCKTRRTLTTVFPLGTAACGGFANARGGMGRLCKVAWRPTTVLRAPGARAARKPAAGRHGRADSPKTLVARFANPSQAAIPRAFSGMRSLSTRKPVASRHFGRVNLSQPPSNPSSPTIGGVV